MFEIYRFQFDPFPFFFCEYCVLSLYPVTELYFLECLVIVFQVFGFCLLTVVIQEFSLCILNLRSFYTS